MNDSNTLVSKRAFRNCPSDSGESRDVDIGVMLSRCVQGIEDSNLFGANAGSGTLSIR